MEPVNTITLALVPAAAARFAENGNLKYGMLYFIKSEVTGQFDGKPYYTSENTDLLMFRMYFRKGMIYEPEALSGPWVINEEKKEEN